MIDKRIRGNFPVLVTPFKEDESIIDEKRLRSHIDRLIEEGVNGLVASGSTAEFASLSREERERIIRITIEHVDGRVPVIVGGMAPSTWETIRWCKFAEDLGAVGVMVVSPYYGAQTDEALYQHFKTVAESVSIPVMPYNNIDTSGNDLVPDIMIRLVKEDKIHYMKACVDTRRIQIIKGACGDEINIFTGVDDLMFQAFALGAVGCVSGGSNVIPWVVNKLWSLLVENNDLKAAREPWYKYEPLATIFETSKTWLPDLKAACAMVGDPVGNCRRPFLPTSEEKKKEIRGLLENLGAL